MKSVADPETSEGRGPSNTNNKPPCAVTIFFMTIIYRLGGGGTSPPLDPLLKKLIAQNNFRFKRVP